MGNRKYSIEDNLNRSEDRISGLVAIFGLGCSAAGIAFPDVDMVIAGGVLFTGGALANAAGYVKAYVKTRVQYMNDRAEEK